jgi:transcription termination factor Rho
MSVLDRGALQASPLADLHVIASELSIDGYRRLRREELIDAILQRQGGGAEAAAEPADEESGEAPAETESEPAPGRRRGRRGGRSRAPQAEPADAEEEPTPTGSSGRTPEAPPEGVTGGEQESERAEQAIVEGMVELLPGGSGFVRVDPPEPSDEDVYVSAAQVKRCELVTGDRVSGPRRPPRRSERFASLLRVDSVNGRPATELAGGVRFDDLPIAFAQRRFSLDGGDELLREIDRVAPIGRGSRVSIVGTPGTGKSDTLRRLAGALAQSGEEQLWLVLIGVRPEELPEWQSGPVTPAAGLSFAVSAEAQAQALEAIVEQVRRLVVRGAHAVVLIDTLDGVPSSVARKVTAAARNVVDGGSLTVIATASTPVGGETTLITLGQPPSGPEGLPVVDPERSWTMRRQLLG